jgi:hypothetical protein
MIGRVAGHLGRKFDWGPGHGCAVTLLDAAFPTALRRWAQGDELPTAHLLHRVGDILKRFAPDWS